MSPTFFVLLSFDSIIIIYYYLNLLHTNALVRRIGCNVPENFATVYSTTSQSFMTIR